MSLGGDNCTAHRTPLTFGHTRDQSHSPSVLVCRKTSRIWTYIGGASAQGTWSAHSSVFPKEVGLAVGEQGRGSYRRTHTFAGASGTADVRCACDGNTPSTCCHHKIPRRS